MLLERGAKFSPATFWQAVQKGHSGVVSLLVEAGADPNQPGGDEGTPVEAALRYRHRAVAEALLAKGAKLTPQERDKALKNAVLRGETEIADLLLQRGGDPSSVLHDAALKGHAAIVRLLLERGAPIESVSATGSRALHDAALGGHAAVVELLLDRGADIHAAESETGATALHMAASYGRRSVLLVLLDRGADPKRTNNAGKTPREAALESGQNEMATMLP
jgi:ankyrin repeat protein